MISLHPSSHSLPLFFAQVREDPRQEEAMLRHLIGRRPRVLMIASGGCSAAYLAGKSLAAEIHLVDAQAAQLALARLKLELLRAPPAERRALLGWDVLPQRLAGLSHHLVSLGLTPADLGPIEVIGAIGPDFCGRYEQLFVALQDALAPHRGELAAILCGQREYAPGQLADSLRRACDSCFDLALLMRLFGPAATQQARQSFAAHFFQRLELALADAGRSANPWLHSMLLGSQTKVLPPWLELPQQEPSCRVTWQQATMSDALRQAQKEGRVFDLIQISNILDWLDPLEAEAVLDAAADCLAPGGRLLVRLLNSRLEIPALSRRWTWLPAPACLTRIGDRSFFYPDILVGVAHED